MFLSGQRWYSQGEPELGLGIVLEIESKRLKVLFPLSKEERIYSTSTHPLKRFKLVAGDSIEHQELGTITIDEVFENNSILFYKSGENVIPEMELPAKIDLNGPLDRLLVKDFDNSNFFQTRYNAYLALRKYQQFKYKGFLSPKIRLLPHQIYVVNEVINMPKPKVMLCDEVGLGKTIQACLILNNFIQTAQIEKCLIIVPDSLVNQWFIELYKKFNLAFKTIHRSSEEEITNEDRFIILGKNYLNENINLTEKLESLDFDALIIDEAHQFNLKQTDSKFANFINNINQKSFTTLLLSATPEVLGTTHLFDQLNFLDPVKYNDQKMFNETIELSSKISLLLEKENLHTRPELLSNLLKKEELEGLDSDAQVKKVLIDRYGTGRGYFRNSRKNLEKFSRLFNDRLLFSYPLQIEKNQRTDRGVFQAKANQVFEIINSHKDSKVLIVCHSKKLVLALSKFILESANMKLATFHSDQTLMERDRQAAYFADPEGAQILITTEVGTEGRNFEFANQLILLDLPKLPDQLEQRIGRLDRIGQENDIHIHVPYITNSFEEILFNWYHKVLNSFTSSPPGANTFYEKNHTELKNILESDFNPEMMEKFIDKKTEEYILYKKELEEGKDLLIERNSYNDESAKNILKEISEYENTFTPQEYFEDICETIGIDTEELNQDSFFAVPSDNMLLPSFAGLPSEGLSLSVNREYILKMPQVEFLSWESQLIKSSFDLMLGSALGNTTFVTCEEIKQDLYFEFIISYQTVDSYKHKSSYFLPFTPIRILLNTKNEDLTKRISKKFIDSQITQQMDEDSLILDQLPKEFLVNIFKLALNHAGLRSSKYLEVAKSNLKQQQSTELNRLKNSGLSEDDKQLKLSEEKAEYEKILMSLENSKLQIDALRIILGKS